MDLGDDSVIMENNILEAAQSPMQIDGSLIELNTVRLDSQRNSSFKAKKDSRQFGSNNKSGFSSNIGKKGFVLKQFSFKENNQQYRNKNSLSHSPNSLRVIRKENSVPIDFSSSLTSNPKNIPPDCGQTRSYEHHETPPTSDNFGSLHPSGVHNFHGISYGRANYGDCPPIAQQSELNMSSFLPPVHVPKVLMVTIQHPVDLVNPMRDLREAFLSLLPNVPFNIYDRYPSFPMFNMSIKIMMWNVQGARKLAFMATFKEIVRINKPNVVALVETHLSGKKAQRVCDRIGFSDQTRVEAQGFSGGIWLFWRREEVTVNPIEVHS